MSNNVSRLAKKEIVIPEGITVELRDKTISVSGPKGTLKFIWRSEVEAKIADGKIQVVPKEGKAARALPGTIRQIMANMIIGVSQGWSKTLDVVGTGYRVNLEGGKLIFSLGFSHKIEIEPGEGITFSVSDNKVTVSGADKALVGEMAAKIHQLRPPDAYKGKGIRYQGERIRLKPGKTTKVGVTAQGK